VARGAISIEVARKPLVTTRSPLVQPSITFAAQLTNAVTRATVMVRSCGLRRLGIKAPAPQWRLTCVTGVRQPSLRKGLLMQHRNGQNIFSRLVDKKYLSASSAEHWISLGTSKKRVEQAPVV